MKDNPHKAYPHPTRHTKKLNTITPTPFPSFTILTFLYVIISSHRIVNVLILCGYLYIYLILPCLVFMIIHRTLLITMLMMMMITLIILLLITLTYINSRHRCDTLAYVSCASTDTIFHLHSAHAYLACYPLIVLILFYQSSFTIVVIISICLLLVSRIIIIRSVLCLVSLVFATN